MIKYVMSLTLFLSACNATIPVTAAETVGTLTPSQTHVSSAPVHATTDLEPTALVVAPDAPSANQSVAGSDSPEITPKDSHGF